MYFYLWNTKFIKLVLAVLAVFHVLADKKKKIQISAVYIYIYIYIYIHIYMHENFLLRISEYLDML